MAVEFARLGGNIVIASRNPEHHVGGLAAVEAVDAKAIALQLDVRFSIENQLPAVENTYPPPRGHG